MVRDMNRRQFLKGAAFTGAAAFAAGSMGACSPSSSGGSDGDAAEAQGAASEWGTFDENGMFTPQFLIDPGPIPEEDIADVVDTEVVVVGMGLAGMSAARAALEEGAEVFVVEKGTTHHTHSHQFHAINCQAAKDNGAELTQEEIDLLIDSEMNNFHERIDRRMWSYLLNHCGEDFDWYLSLTDKYTVVNPNELVGETDLDAKALVNVCTAGLAGIVGRVFDDVDEEREKAVLENAPYICVFNHPLNPNFDLASERYPMSPGVVTVEPTHEILGNNVAAFVEEKATVKYASWARRILRDEESGRVTGLVYEDEDGAYHQVNASKGVILCSGDFAGNTAMVNYFQDCHRLLQGGDLGWPDIDAKGERTNLGEGLSMAYWIGAKTDTTHACCNDHYGGALGCDPMLFVDGKGERFMNEDVTGEILGEKVNRVAGEVIWQVFDSNYPDQIAGMPVGHRTYWKVVDDYDQIPMGLFLDPIGMITRQEVESWPGLCEPADTIEELAQNMGVDPETFKATVERYNEMYDNGEDVDFGKRADRLTEVRTPPFYAAQMGPLGYQTFYGSVCCDEQTRVIDQQNNVIPGFYVAGTAMGSRFWNVYPNTAMGVNHAGALSYGRLAGKNAAQGV